MKKKVLVFLIPGILMLIGCERNKPDPPDFSNKITLMTGNVKEITCNSAKIEGKLGETYGQKVQDYGHCWDTFPDPQINNHYSSFGQVSKGGKYVSELIELEPGKQYFVKAYFRINDVLIYGEDTSFTTLSGIPVVYLDTVYNITAISAICAARVTDKGGATLNSIGISWKEKDNPLSEFFQSDCDMRIDSFNCMLSDLQPGTVYNIRVFATNELGTFYGKMNSFVTRDGIPKVTTAAVTDITDHSAVTGGDVTDDGGAGIIKRGVCWNLTGNPTINDHRTSDGEGTGEFVSLLFELTAQTDYYIRAYATTIYGTAYGEEIFFSNKTSGILTDTRDGNTYPWIKTGDQVWMAQNLAFLPEVYPSSVGSEVTPLFYVYGYDSTNVNEAKNTENYSLYGVLYNWNAAMNSDTVSVNNGKVKGICPDGWHLPGDDEWKELEKAIGMDTEEIDDMGLRGMDEGDKLKDTEGWNPEASGTNESQFSALPGGMRTMGNGSFNYMGNMGNWWSSTLKNGKDACFRRLFNDRSGIYRYHYNRSYGFSVRCVRDRVE